MTRAEAEDQRSKYFERVADIHHEAYDVLVGAAAERAKRAVEQRWRLYVVTHPLWDNITKDGVDACEARVIPGLANRFRLVVATSNGGTWMWQPGTAAIFLQSHDSTATSSEQPPRKRAVDDTWTIKPPGTCLGCAKNPPCCDACYGRWKMLDC